MKKYGFVASGGGYRSFYTAGALVWLKKNNVSINHLTSTSSGNNIVLDYMVWDWDSEEFPPTLTKTLRLKVTDIAQVFANFLGLRPALLPAGTHLFTVDKDNCRRSLLLDDPHRRTVLQEHLAAVKWDIFATNLTKREKRSFRINEMLSEIDDSTLSQFMDAFLAGITTIPYFKAITIGQDFYVEGGYLDNTPMRTLFEDPEVDEIIAIDFTDHDYHADLEKLYHSQMLTLPFNSINMFLLVSDMGLTLPNKKIFSQAEIINKLLEATGRDSIAIEGKTYHRKPVHVLRPENLQSMTISLKDSTAQKDYFKLGQQEAEALFSRLS
ncbi:MAG: patatin-like phospholipase family protein [Gammaproteobacteria bacterium]|jgi:predicted acylesterase/phospholipase RssA